MDLILHVISLFVWIHLGKFINWYLFGRDRPSIKTEKRRNRSISTHYQSSPTCWKRSKTAISISPSHPVKSSGIDGTPLSQKMSIWQVFPLDTRTKKNEYYSLIPNPKAHQPGSTALLACFSAFWTFPTKVHSTELRKSHSIFQEQPMFQAHRCVCVCVLLKVYSRYIRIHNHT